jgi:hypothetical protein
MTRRARGLAKLKRLYDAMLAEEVARGILPQERALLERME